MNKTLKTASYLFTSGRPAQASDMLHTFWTTSLGETSEKDLDFAMNLEEKLQKILDNLN